MIENTAYREAATNSIKAMIHGQGFSHSFSHMTSQTYPIELSKCRGSGKAGPTAKQWILRALKLHPIEMAGDFYKRSGMEYCTSRGTTRSRKR